MILLCYDGSPSAEHANLGRPIRLPCRAGHAVERLEPAVPVADSFGIAAAPAPLPFDDLEQFASERAEAIARQGCEHGRGLGIPVEARVERGDSSVWQTILDVADELDAELIVPGTPGVTAVESALLGSVSRRPPLRTPAAGRAQAVSK
jgi:nucleotide-binding universal stress UspA family protein